MRHNAQQWNAEWLEGRNTETSKQWRKHWNVDTHHISEEIFKSVLQSFSELCCLFLLLLHLLLSPRKKIAARTFYFKHSRSQKNPEAIETKLFYILQLEYWTKKKLFLHLFLLLVIFLKDSSLLCIQIGSVNFNFVLMWILNCFCILIALLYKIFPLSFVYLFRRLLLICAARNAGFKSVLIVCVGSAVIWIFMFQQLSMYWIFNSLQTFFSQDERSFVAEQYCDWSATKHSIRLGNFIFCSALEFSHRALHEPSPSAKILFSFVWANCRTLNWDVDHSKSMLK